MQDPLSIEQLKAMAQVIRHDIITMIHTAQAGHPGGSLSAADIITALYFRIMRLDPADPHWPDRDRFILSKGHACPVWYAALAERGFFDKSHLATLRKLDSILQGHADMKKTPGVDMTVGSLGQGICAGLGMALAGKLHGKDYHVYVIIGDGESQEGAVWEAAMAAPRWKLDNLTVIVDNNGIQNDTFTDDIMPVEPLAEKWRAFRWNVIEIDGHKMEEIVSALESVSTRPEPVEARPQGASASSATVLPRPELVEGRVAQRKGVPTVIIAKTVKGRGVSFMENVPAWHGAAPNDAQAEAALAEIAEGLR
jgi:transketolase